MLELALNMRQLRTPECISKAFPGPGENPGEAAPQAEEPALKKPAAKKPKKTPEKTLRLRGKRPTRLRAKMLRASFTSHVSTRISVAGESRRERRN